MINVQAIDHVVFRVADFEKVAAFYMDVLGARRERRREEMDLHQLRLGNFLIDLVPVDSPLGRLGRGPPGADPHNVDHVAFRVLPWMASRYWSICASTASKRRSNVVMAPVATDRRSISRIRNGTESSSKDRLVPIPTTEQG